MANPPKKTIGDRRFSGGELHDRRLPPTSERNSMANLTEAREQEADRVENSLAGKLLIASPAIDDPRFARAVILVCTHNEDHAMGIVLNKSTDGIRLPDLLDQLGVDGDDA